jgi:chromosome segregation protein
MATAMRIYPTCAHVIVTQRGEVITKEGILQGGRAAESGSGSVLERKVQIQGLEEHLSELRLGLAARSDERDDIALRLIRAEERLEELRGECQRASMQLSTLRGEAAVAHRELTEARRRHERLEDDRQGAAAREAEAGDRMRVIEGELADVERVGRILEEKRALLTSELEVLRAEESAAIAELNEIKIAVATERQRHTSLHQQRTPLEHRLGELRHLTDQRLSEIESYEERAGALEVENAEIEASLANLRSSVGEAERELAAIAEQRIALVAEVEEAAARTRDQRATLSRLVSQKGQSEVRLTQLQMRADAASDHVRKRYQVEVAMFTPDAYTLAVTLREIGRRVRKVDAVGAEPEEMSASAQICDDPEDGPATETQTATLGEIDWVRVDALVKELDQRLASMGPVNLDAIAEYEELEQRDAFLGKQHNDLEAAKKELLEIIEKINFTTRSMFADTFEKIRLNFQEMFRELFGGGHANLILTEESDPLESGIEIIAKPPGKQLTSITLLSGGEKTMTAVAMLFSIYMVKPSPFCVLDEMDAPLDESNINRFIRILDRFVTQSQFVVISHNKRTIARADAIYGVTMEEHGVSKLVGVRFNKRDESKERSDILGSTNATPIPSVAESFGKSPQLLSEQTGAA